MTAGSILDTPLSLSSVTVEEAREHIMGTLRQHMKRKCDENHVFMQQLAGAMACPQSLDSALKQSCSRQDLTAQPTAFLQPHEKSWAVKPLCNS